MRKLIRCSDHPALSEFKNNLNQSKGKTIEYIFVAEDESGYFEIHFEDGSGARIDVHCEGAPVARAGIVFLANVKRVHPYQRRRTSSTRLVV